MPSVINPNNNRWPRNFPVDGKESKDTMWLKMVVWKITSQNLNVRDAGGIDAERIGELYFLPVNEVAENLSHSWEEYKGFSGRLAQKVAEISHLEHEVVNAGKSTAAAVQSIVKGQGGGSVLSNALAKSTVQQFKVDSPLVYKESERREYMFQFTLADQGNIVSDIMEPVDYLRRFSCAEKKETIQIDFPYIFSLDTVNSYGRTTSIVNVPRAILRGVQPTFSGPYRDGLPSKCEVQCTFVDMEPLYRSTWDYGSSKVTSSERGFGTETTAEEITEVTQWLDEGPSYGK